MMPFYILAFCRVTIGLVFAWSFVGKIQNIASFVQTINRFNLLPKALHWPVAVMFLGGELAVLGAMILGGNLLLWGFLLAGLLLIIFSVALIVVLIRKIQTPCNCFGSSQKPASIFDIVRNAALILFSLGSYGLSVAKIESSQVLSWMDWVLIAVVAIVFVMTLVQLGDIVQLFR